MSELGDYYEEYIKEVIDGEVYYMSPGISVHAWTVTRLGHKFYDYLKLNNKKCEVFTENIEVYLNGKDDKNFVVPDISIICDVSKFDKRGYRGAPELIVEVLSPATAKKDKEEKLLAYEKASVKEYWIVDTKSKSIEQRILKDGKYKLENFVILMDEVEFDKLTEDQKNKYTTNIKPHIFPELEIDLNELFNYYWRQKEHL